MRVAKVVNVTSMSALLAAVLFASASCRSQPPTSLPVAPAIETPAPNDIERLSALDPRLKDQLLVYRAKEGDAHRSDEFYNLAMQLDETCFSGRWIRTRTKPVERAKHDEVLSFLGLPDCGRRVGADAGYAYFFWRTDTKSMWVAHVEIKDGLLEQIGWNDASVNDLSKLRQYRNWADVMGGDH